MTRRIAVVLETYHDHGRSVMRGVASYVERGRTWELHAVPIGRNESNILQAAVAADGVITWPHSSELEAVIENARVPTVAVDYWGNLPIPRVRSNPWSTARMAAEHLIAQGFRQFAFFGLRDRPFSIERQIAFEQAVNSHGFPCTIHNGARTTPTVFGWKERDETLVRWLRSLPKPIGVLAANDMSGQELLLSAQHANVRVPDEMALVGIDNDELVCRMTTPPLSSIDIASERMGFDAAALLDAMFQGEDVGAPMVLVEPAKLVVRQSSDVLAVQDPSVAEAVRFIRQNVRQNIGVRDVLHEIPMSRRALELAFRKSLGRSIHEEISESRIRQAKQLLVDTDMTITEITESCGFNHRRRLDAVFRKTTGHSPAVYRREFRKPR